MTATTVPHYLLFSEASPVRPGRFVSRYVAGDGAQLCEAAGRWRFVLESVDGEDKFEASDVEGHVSGERLELLAVVRGLEAIEQPSRVTLLTPSRYVSRGIRYGLEEWRENQWQWECFGKMMPVKNGDLWRRVDQALRIHQVNCRSWAAESADAEVAGLPRNVAKARPAVRMESSAESLAESSAECVTTSDSPIDQLCGIPCQNSERVHRVGEPSLGDDGVCTGVEDERGSDDQDEMPLGPSIPRPIMRTLQHTWQACLPKFSLTGVFRLRGAKFGS